MYTGSHTYPGYGTYLLTVTDPNRTNSILNIPNSVNVAFCLHTLLVIDPMVAANSSTRFTNMQTEAAFSFSTLVHDPGAVDTDGDSLSFELVEPLGDACQSIPGYVPADQVVPGTPLFWLDPTTGTLLWDHPQLIGRYNVVIRCSEWRNGQLIGQVTRDMTLGVDQVPTAMAEAAPAAAPTVRTLDTEGLYQVEPPGTAVRSVHDAQGRVLPADLRAPGLVDLSERPAGLYLVQVQAPTGAPRMIRVLRP